MIFHVIDKKIRKAFSDAALQYDTLTSLHKEIGRELIKKIEKHEPCSAVLDIGMGTGWFTNRLTDIFLDAQVVGLDFACGMIADAQKKDGEFKIIQADAKQLPFKDSVFDIITSNLAYQWIDHLTDAFRLCRLGLNKTGILCFTMFGHDTFHELFTALKICTDEKKQQNNFNVRRLAGQDSVTKALKEAEFHDVQVSTERIKVRFSDMMHLIKWVKDIGANALPKDFYIGKELLFRSNEYYNAHFHDRLGVYATFEVIWVEARR